jgi:hypothetical protein
VGELGADNELFHSQFELCTREQKINEIRLLEVMYQYARHCFGCRVIYALQVPYGHIYLLLLVMIGEAIEYGTRTFNFSSS